MEHRKVLAIRGPKGDPIATPFIYFFSTSVISEEIKSKCERNSVLKNEIAGIFTEIRQKCSPFGYTLLLRNLCILRREFHEEQMSIHSNKLRLLNKELDVEKHITNLSSYKLSFFEKLVLYRGLKFSIPQPVSTTDVQASFEKTF